MAVCLLSIGFLQSDKTGQVATACPQHFRIPFQTKYLKVILLLFLNISFGLGIGTIPWILTPEVFTFAARGRALALTNMFSFTAMFCMLSFTEHFENFYCAYMFWTFGGLCLLWTMYVSVGMVNSDGLTCLEANQLFVNSRRSSNRSTVSRSTMPFTHTASLTRNEYNYI